MGSIKEAAKEYEPNTFKNVSVLESIDVDAEVKEEKKQNSEGEDYTVKYIEVDGEKYRVPFTVLRDLKSILTKKPDLKSFCVSRVGTTKEDTKYTVIPL